MVDVFQIVELSELVKYFFCEVEDWGCHVHFANKCTLACRERKYRSFQHQVSDLKRGSRIGDRQRWSHD